MEPIQYCVGYYNSSNVQLEFRVNTVSTPKRTFIWVLVKNRRSSSKIPIHESMIVNTKFIFKIIKVKKMIVKAI